MSPRLVPPACAAACVHACALSLCPRLVPPLVPPACASGLCHRLCPRLCTGLCPRLVPSACAPGLYPRLCPRLVPPACAPACATACAPGLCSRLVLPLVPPWPRGLPWSPVVSRWSAVDLKEPEIHTQGVKHTRTHAEAHASTSRRNRACTQAVSAEPPLARKPGFSAIRLRVPLCARPQVCGL